MRQPPNIYKASWDSRVCYISWPPRGEPAPGGWNHLSQRQSSLRSRTAATGARGIAQRVCEQGHVAGRLGEDQGPESVGLEPRQQEPLEDSRARVSRASTRKSTHTHTSYMCTHMHTHRHPCTHISVHVETHIHICTYRHTHLHMCTQTRAYTQKQGHTYVIPMVTCTDTQAYAHTQHACTWAHIHIHTHAHT